MHHACVVHTCISEPVVNSSFAMILIIVRSPSAGTLT